MTRSGHEYEYEEEEGQGQNERRVLTLCERDHRFSCGPVSITQDRVFNESEDILPLPWVHDDMFSS